eukprot:gb/GEZJ01004513.1/.p2 GENE.gb/GEZJ01004513.1/~~gb/GEZJ01004513.1/.p2  ORF type:complete len:112 (+),score=7.14 gb/GEZJ01004513.1/:87-422(+)
MFSVTACSPWRFFRLRSLRLACGFHYSVFSLNTEKKDPYGRLMVVCFTSNIVSTPLNLSSMASRGSTTDATNSTSLTNNVRPPTISGTRICSQNERLGFLAHRGFVVETRP